VPQQRNWVRAYKHLVAKPMCVRRPKFRQPLKLLVPAYPLGFTTRSSWFTASHPTQILKLNKALVSPGRQWGYT